MSVVNQHNSENLCHAQTGRTRNIDQLISNARPGTKKLERVLLEFADHYHNNPVLLPYLVRQLRQQVRKQGWACFDLAWASALVKLRTPGGAEYKLRHALKSWYGRGILYCHPKLNGWLEVCKAAPNDAFGMAVAKTKLPGDYARRLEWADGTPLTEPQPAFGRKPQSVRPQGELFEVAA
jgi:hypothetical protein